MIPVVQSDTTVRELHGPDVEGEGSSISCPLPRAENESAVRGSKEKCMAERLVFHLKWLAIRQLCWNGTMNGWRGSVIPVGSVLLVELSLHSSLPSLGWCSLKTRTDFSITRAAPNPSLQELCFPDLWNVTCDVPKCLYLSLLQLLVKSALNYRVSSPFAGCCWP